MGILKTKPKHHLSIGNGAFIADFYVDEKTPDIKRNYLHIYAPNGVFSQKIVGYPFGYLLAAVLQGKEEEVHSYCVMLWRVSQEVYQDLAFCQDIVKAINKRDKRLLKKAEQNAVKVTKEQEMADAEFMKEAIAYSEASPKEQKHMSKEYKEKIKETIKEIKNGK